MKKKLLIIFFILFSFCSGAFISWFLCSIFHDPHLFLCRKIPLSEEEKQMVLSNYTPTPNPFFNIPNWYNKEDLLKTKNFYIQNSSDDNQEKTCLSSNDIYSWNKNAYLEFEEGDFYKVLCSK